MTRIIVTFEDKRDRRYNYPSIGQSPVTEYRSVYIATTIVFLMLIALSFLVQHVSVYSRAIFLISWFLCLVIIPAMRSEVIHWLCKKKMWGEPVIIIGLNNRTPGLIQSLESHPEYGFKPTLILNFSEHEKDKNSFRGIPVLNITNNLKIKDLGNHFNIQTVMVISADLDQEKVNHFLKAARFHFSRTIVIPEKQLGSHWVTPLDIGGVLGFETKKNLLSSSHQISKRILPRFHVAIK
ncbi:MAG: hypothetical protein NTZ74_02950 [Chloroflexi bacterium]|nr:hypothetical protein [Chloroflexota bacterium]